MSGEGLRKEYGKHEFHPWVMRYEAEKTPESKTEMKRAYGDIFLSTKHAMHEGQISESEFYRLIYLIQEEW